MQDVLATELPRERPKDGKDHIYWSLVETVQTVDGPRQLGLDLPERFQLNRKCSVDPAVA